MKITKNEIERVKLTLDIEFDLIIKSSSVSDEGFLTFDVEIDVVDVKEREEVKAYIVDAHKTN